MFHHKLFLCFFLLFSLLGCDNTTSIEKVANNRTHFYITPVIEGANLCNEAISHKPTFKTPDEAINWCINNGYNGASLINRSLEILEPGGAKGNVQVGYELSISLLDLFVKQNGVWSINEQKVNSYLEIIKNVNRPVVIYLMSNHFDSKGQLSKELSKDPQNLMLLKNGKPPIDNYFSNSIIPFTLLTDDSIPVNHYRFYALRYVGKKILELPQYAKDRIIGITMAGETHQMYPDFTNGVAEYDNYMVTDYSESSIKGFQIWLKDKYKSIEKLNKTMGSRFKSFEEIDPPQKDVHKEKLNSFTEHYDAYASGVIPISGWLWDPNSVYEKLALYIDGNRIGDIPQGYNRLDVYRAVKEINNPNVGFRYDLDYRNLSLGSHKAQVVAESSGKLYFLDQVKFVVERNQGGSSIPLSKKRTKFINDPMLNGIKHFLDYPKQPTHLYYNPLARDWDKYRGWQVANFLQNFWRIAVEDGLPKDKLFSHQIYPRVNSTWNPGLFMVDLSISKAMPYKLGINLYGGATNSSIVRKFLKNQQTFEYGVPEFHVQQWKLPNSALEALKAQYDDGARFISPYYISIIPDSLKKEKKGDTLQKLNISPNNKFEGSNLLYKAIFEFAKR